MNRKFLLFILLVYSKVLFSAELTLRSENIFVCDIIEENSNSVTILFKSQKYVIPRSEIITINHDITGKHISYQNSILTLVDGSVVKGQLAEETPEIITLKKGNEFLAVPRNSVSDYKKAENKTYSLPDSYKLIEKDKSMTAATWNLGFYGAAFKNGYIIGDSNYGSYGGGLFLEPSFLKLGDRWLFGFQSEYLASGGRLSYSFFQNFFYVQFNHILFGLNFYYKLGAGTSYITLTESEETVSTLRGGGTFETGWQNSITDKYILRIGIRANGIYEKPEVWDTIGAQISVGYRL